MICKYFLPFGMLPFHFVDGFHAVQKLFSLIASHLFLFAFVASVFLITLGTVLDTQGCRLFPSVHHLTVYTASSHTSFNLCTWVRSSYSRLQVRNREVIWFSRGHTAG